MSGFLIENDVLLAPFTTFKIGGKARYFVRVRNTEELKKALDFAKQNQGLAVFILGGGSNILVSDEEFNGLVIKMEMKGIEWQEEGPSTLLRAAAGESWDDLVSESIDRGLWGMENLSGIPGTVGASVIQNIGAYGADIKQLVRSVEVFDPANQDLKILTPKECFFDYRHSFFKESVGRKLIITNVTYELSRSSQPNISYRDLGVYFKNNQNPTLSEIRRAILNIRSTKFPSLEKFGTAGSFFKNPIISRKSLADIEALYPAIPRYDVDEKRVKLSAAWLIDKVGNFRGGRDGNVGTYENQSLVLVNFGNANADDVKKFSEKIKSTIKEKVGIELEEEVQLLN